MSYEPSTLPLLPLNQTVYLLREVPFFWGKPPYTRVRFDQSSRKTQLLSVWHGQTVRNRGSISFVYHRRTRMGEYLRQNTDQYAAGLRLYTWTGPFWLSAQGGWNQHQEALNGGVVHEGSPYESFRKERQEVRLTGARMRRWYRFAGGEMGLRIFPRVALSFHGFLSEDRIESEGGGTLYPPQGIIFPDSLPFSFGVKQVRRTVGADLLLRNFHLRVLRIELRGSANTDFWRRWQHRAIEAHAAWHSPLFTIEGLYRWWLPTATLPSAFQIEGRWHPPSYEIGGMYVNRNLPWLAYQSTIAPPPNERILRLWAAWRRAAHDTTLPPFEIKLWSTRWENPWLADTQFTTRTPIVSSGSTIRGGLEWGIAGFIAGIQLQHLWAVPSLWQRAFPPYVGWIQPFLRWQFKKLAPVYYLGVRISAFGQFQPLYYDIPLGNFYLAPTPGQQRAYVWADPYFVVLIRRVMVYLRVDHASEGLLARGYYLTAWYPMPGRSFSFGVQWDISD